MTTVREIQLDELEALVISVIGETRGLRLDAGMEWNTRLRRLEALVQTLLVQLDVMKQAGRRSFPLDLHDCLPAARH